MVVWYHSSFEKCAMCSFARFLFGTCLRWACPFYIRHHVYVATYWPRMIRSIWSWWHRYVSEIILLQRRCTMYILLVPPEMILVEWKWRRGSWLAATLVTWQAVVDQRKYQGSASLAFVRGIHRWPVNSVQKWPVTRKMFPFDDVVMEIQK